MNFSLNHHLSGDWAVRLGVRLKSRVVPRDKQSRGYCATKAESGIPSGAGGPNLGSKSLSNAKESLKPKKVLHRTYTGKND